MKVIIDIPKFAYDEIVEMNKKGKAFNLLEAVAIGTPISDNATNGDMIKAMFPNGKEYDNDGDVRYEIEIDFDYSFCSYFDGVWWNSPYKKEVEE
jgi:hypothetical protein